MSNVFAIQYQINASHIFESVYSLATPVRQITSHTLDVIRATLPHMELEEIFLSRGAVANDLYISLNDVFNEYGFLIQHVLITSL